MYSIMHRHVVRDRFITKLWYFWLSTVLVHLNIFIQYYNTDSIVLQGCVLFYMELQRRGTLFDYHHESVVVLYLS